MAAALTAPVAANALEGAQAFIGDTFTVVGTGFANTTAFTVKVSTAEESLDLTINGTTSGGGALTTVGLVTMKYLIPGMWTIVASDGTSTVTIVVEVFES